MAVVVLLGHGIDTLAAATLAGSGAVFLLTWLLTWRGVPDNRISPRLVTRRALRELAGFGSQLFLFRLLSVLYRQMDRTVIGIALTASLVTTYEIANKFYASAALIESIATSSLVPAVAFASADRHTLRDMLKRGTNYALAATLPVAIAVIVFAEPLIRTWIGSDHTDAATPTRLLVAALIPSFLIAVGQTMLVGLGRIRTMLYLVAAWAALNLGLSIWLVHPLGVNGPILATLISSSLLLPAVTWLFLREVDVDLGEWLHDVVAPVLPAAAIQALVAAALLQLAGGTDSLPVVALLCAVTMAAFVAAYYRLGLDAIHRDALRSTLRRAAGLDPPGAELATRID
jgi:O-antigen/teichoic acid export membrane protein